MSEDANNISTIEGLTPDEAELFEDILSDFGASRRKFLGQSTATALGALVLEFLARRNALAGVDEELFSAPIADENAVTVAFKVNGVSKSLTLDSRVTLLDAFRYRL